ncbi:MAG: hypothetical protein RSG52_00745 [Terrisporobacter sp.]|uniref:hypothetical protein n=1 Tax=Terrisporobacter sp. TaxID=1965305 RepID=UPI002FC8D24F
MQDLKRNKRKMYNKQISNMKAKNVAPIVDVEEDLTEFDRGCKNKTEKNSCGCANENHHETEVNSGHCGGGNNVAPTSFNCQCTCTPGSIAGEQCQPCTIESNQCQSNSCGEDCCCPIDVEYSTKNTRPVAIEVERIYDAIQFQIFTDATAPDGEPLYFDCEVAEVKGRVPSSGYANIKIDEVCMNYSSIEVIPGCIGVDDFEVVEVEENSPCDTEFSYVVCPERNAKCCAKCKGQSVSYKQKGLTAIVNDLVLELRGHCGCTEVVAYAYPAIRRIGGNLCRVDTIEFRYNTLSARICCPSNGKSFELEQDYDVNLTVDCIAKAYISAEPCGCECDCECDFNLEIPSGIDLICCLQEEVSVIVEEQIVVLGASGAVNPRVVDTFANVCTFPSCGAGN